MDADELTARWRVVVVTAVLVVVAAALAIWVSRLGTNRIPRVAAVAFSPDGRWLATGAVDGGIAVWAVGSATPMNLVRLSGGGINALAFSPDGARLAGAGRSVEVWRSSDWGLERRLGADGAVYGTVRFSPDGRLAATVNSAEQIELWDAATGERRRTICCMALYGDVAFSADGRVLAAAGHWPRLWDVATGREIRRLVETREPTFGAIAFRRDGLVIATGSQDGRVRLWDAATGSEVGKCGSASGLRRVG